MTILQAAIYIYLGFQVLLILLVCVRIGILSFQDRKEIRMREKEVYMRLYRDLNGVKSTMVMYCPLEDYAQAASPDGMTFLCSWIRKTYPTFNSFEVFEAQEVDLDKTTVIM